MTGTSITVGNILSLCAAVSDSISGTRKKHKEIMAIQIVSRFFYGASSIVLKGYSSTAQNAVAVFRSLTAMKKVKSRVLEWILVAASVVLGIASCAVIAITTSISLIKTIKKTFGRNRRRESRTRRNRKGSIAPCSAKKSPPTVIRPRGFLN